MLSSTSLNEVNWAGKWVCEHKSNRMSWTITERIWIRLIIKWKDFEPLCQDGDYRVEGGRVLRLESSIPCVLEVGPRHCTDVTPLDNHRSASFAKITDVAFDITSYLLWTQSRIPRLAFVCPFSYFLQIAYTAKSRSIIRPKTILDTSK